MFQSGNQFQKYQSKRISSQRNKINEFIVEETLIKVGSQHISFWVAIIEPKKGKFSNKAFPKKEICLLHRAFSIKLFKRIRQVSCFNRWRHMWYPQACRFLKLQHHIHSSQEKSSIERTMQYIKNRTESFNDYFPCMKKRCKLKHVKQWLNLFVDYYNRGITA